MLAGWPAAFEVRAGEYLQERGYKRVGVLDLAELWVLENSSHLPRQLPLPDGFRRHLLRAEDAELVNAGWEHGTSATLPVIRQCIEERPSFAVSSPSGELAGWALTRHDGSIGVVVVLPKYRGLGLGTWVVANLAKQLGSTFVYISSENSVSQKLHRKLGFVNFRNTFAWTTYVKK